MNNKLTATPYIKYVGSISILIVNETSIPSTHQTAFVWDNLRGIKDMAVAAQEIAAQYLLDRKTRTCLLIDDEIRESRMAVIFVNIAKINEETESLEYYTYQRDLKSN